MRQMILTLVFTFITFSASFAQEKNKEVFLLRAMLGVSQSTPISLKTSGALPDKTPLKVYLNTNKEVKVRNNFLEWLREWNELEGPKYGSVEVVTDFSSADIALVRITDTVVRMGDPGGTYETTSEIDPATRKPVNTPTSSKSTEFAVDVYSYIVVKENGELRTLRRYIEAAIINSSFLTLNTGMIADMERVQGNVSRAVNDGTIDSKSRKDKKVAGDRLRDEFFKLLKARTKKS